MHIPKIRVQGNLVLRFAFEQPRPGRVTKAVARPTKEPEVPDSIPSPAI